MFKVVTGTTHATATSSNDFTVAGFGTVAGAIVYINSSTASSNPNTTAATAWMSHGFFDGTNQVSKMEASKDNESTTTDTWKYSWSDKIGGYTNNAGTVQAAFSISKTDNGVTITTDTSDGTAYNCMVVLIPATGVTGIKAFNADWSGHSGSAITVSDVGFEADLVVSASGVNPGPGNVDPSMQAGWPGFTHNVDGTDANVVQMCSGMTTNDARSLGTTWTSTGSWDFYGLVSISNNAGIRYGVRFTNFTQDGWTMKKWDDPDTNPPTTATSATFALEEDTLHLAIQFTGDYRAGTKPNIKVFKQAAPNATGSWSTTTPGFTPTFGMLVTPRCPTSSYNDNLHSGSDSQAVCAFDATNQITMGYLDQDAVATTWTSTYLDSGGIQVYEDQNTSVYDASFSSFDANGWTWSFSTATDTTNADPWIALAIGSSTEGVSKTTFRVKQGFLASGATGTADFTIPGIGSIAGAIVYTNRASLTNDPALAEGDTTWICAGFWDGTTQIAYAHHTEDGITNPGTTDSWNAYSSNKIAYWCNNAGTTQFAATISSVTDGVRITTDTSDGEAHRVMVILIPSSIVANIDAQVVDCSGISGGSVAVTNVGFEADVAFALTGRCTAAETPTADFLHSFGVAINDVGETNHCMHLIEDDGRDMSTLTTYLSNITSDTHVGMRNSNGGLIYGAQIKNFDASGYDILKWDEYVSPSTANNDTSDILVLAIKFTGITDFDVDVYTAPTTAVDWAQTAPGFQPSFGLVFGTEGVVIITSGDDTNAESFSVMPFDGTNMYSFGYNSGDNLSTVTTSAYSLTGWRQVEDNGVPGTDDTFTGTFKSFDTNGFTMNFSAVPGTEDKWPIFTLGEYSAASPIVISVPVGPVR